jgi:hypothetical protein
MASFIKLSVSTLLYDADYLTITYGKKFLVYLGKSEYIILKFQCKRFSAILVNYPILYEGLLTEVS